MIKSLLHFNNPDNLTKDEVSGVSWKIYGTVASYQDGKFGNCLSLNGEGCLQNTTIDLSLDKEWTLDMWICADSYDSSQSFISIKSQAYRHGILFESGHLYLGLKSATWWHTSLNLPTARWVHFALVNQLQTLYVFVDGVEQVKRTNQDIALADSSNILIGSTYPMSTYFDGFIDDFRISNKALWTSNFTPPAHEAQLAKFIFIDKNNTVMGMKG